LRVGCGYDLHRLTEGRKLILGGVEIPYGRGLDGHSDADVALHALCDAILGAAAAGDIGVHFPDSDSRFQGISSLVLLARTYEIIQRKGYQVRNIDITIVAEEPKLKKFIPSMREKIAQVIDSGLDAINIKATTTEGLGSIGRKEGIAAFAVALLFKMDD